MSDPIASGPSALMALPFWRRLMAAMFTVAALGCLIYAVLFLLTLAVALLAVIPTRWGYLVAGVPVLMLMGFGLAWLALFAAGRASDITKEVSP